MNELHDVELVGPSTIGITHYLAASVATIRDPFGEYSLRDCSNLFDFAGGAFRFTSLVWSPLGLSKTLRKFAALSGSCDESHLVKQLRTVNTLAPTKMCRVMTKYGSDKGHGSHNYTTVYSALFKGLPRSASADL